jgi:hypothetical protein
MTLAVLLRVIMVCAWFVRDVMEVRGLVGVGKESGCNNNNNAAA